MPVIDVYDAASGTIASIKSTIFTDKTKMRSVKSKWKRYVNKMIDVKSAGSLKVPRSQQRTLTSGPRQLRLILTRDLTYSEAKSLVEVRDYTRINGVELLVKVVIN